jgi:hypothetical protein
MWDELQPLLDEKQLAAIERPARARLKWQFALAWLAAAAIGVAVYLGTRGPVQAPSAPATAAATAPVDGAAAPPTPTTATPTAPATGAPAAMTAASGAAASPAAKPTAPATSTPVELRRRAIAEAIRKLPHVRSAAWPAESTLQVVVDSDLFDPRARLCPLIENDPDLGASRLQVQYPASADRPVRFLQCRAY